MSQSFDIKRFGKLLRHDVRLCLPHHSTFGSTLISELASVPMLTLFMSLTGEEHGASYRLTMIVLLSIVMATQLPMQIHANIGQKKKRGDIYFAMLPASKLEKYLSIATLTIVLIPIVLLTANLALDSLLTAVHIPFYNIYLWQAKILDQLTLPMYCNCLLALIATGLGFIFLNTVSSKGWRSLLYFILWLWLMGFTMSSAFLGEAKFAVLLWCMVGVQIVFAVLIAWLGWNKMNKMGY